ncbi:unnamed protein product [Amaranthus hypochondriacus]
MANYGAVEFVFKKKLTKTDTKHRFSWPMEHLELLTNLKIGEIDLNFPGHKFDFVAVDQDGLLWPLSCTIRKEGKYAKPVISAGWLSFVHSKNLAIGDEVIFSNTNDPNVGAPTFIIYVKRAT